MLSLNFRWVVASEGRWDSVLQNCFLSAFLLELGGTVAAKSSFCVILYIQSLFVEAGRFFATGGS